MKRSRVKEAARRVLLREGFNSETAERLADLIAHEPIAAAVKSASPSHLGPGRPAPRSLNEHLSNLPEE